MRLNPDDVIVCEIRIDQGMKEENPMLNVRFYQTADPEGGEEPFSMPQQQVTSMLGTIYQGVCLRRGGGREEACSQCLWMRGVLISNSFSSSVEDSLGPIQAQSACTDLVASKRMQFVSVLPSMCI